MPRMSTHHQRKDRPPARVPRVAGLSPLSIASLFALLPAIAHSQSVDAVLRGKASDETGAGLSALTVILTAERGGVVRSATTDPEGHYLLLNLPAGGYEFRAELDGFTPMTRRALVLYVGTTVNFDFALKLAGLVSSVDVREDSPALETSKNTLTRIVQTAEIDALPVINRNFNDLAALAPGVTKTGVYGGVDIGGSRDFQNAYQVDGVSAERQHRGDQRIAYAQDWIQEFQVLTSQFNAEFGQAAGGVLNVITRAGGNQIAARAYGFLRNDAWDATPALVTRKPPLSELRMGGTVGGPVVKGRVFYFGGLERFDNASSNVVNSTFASSNGAFPSTDGQTLSLAKLDVVASQAHSIRLRYNRQRQRTTGASIGGTGIEEHGDYIGTLTSTQFGQPTTAGPKRRTQLGFRVDF